MNDFYLIARMLGLIFGIGSVILSFLLLIEGDKKLSFAFLIFGTLLCVVGGIGANKYIDYQKMYNDKCLNDGFVEAYNKGNSWYCLSFGNEPRIVFAGIEE